MAKQSALEGVKEATVTISDGETEVTMTPEQLAELPKMQLMQAINDQDWKVAEQKQNVKVANEIYTDEVEALPAFKEVDRLSKELENAKTRLDQEKLNSPEVQSAADKLAEEKSELKIRSDYLSALLVQYSAGHKVRTIIVDDENHEIKLSAKIGRKLKEQMELPL